MWEKYGFVVSSKYRIITTVSLMKHPKTPSQIANEINCQLSHISRALKQLMDENIVECINPNVTRGRMYKLSDIGIKIAKQLMENGVDRRIK